MTPQVGKKQNIHVPEEILSDLMFGRKLILCKGWPKKQPLAGT